MRRAAVLLLATALPAAAQVELVEAGIVCPREPEGELVPAPDTELGAIRLIEQATAFDLDARVVPTIPLLSFGIRVAPEAGAGPLDAAIVIEHPPMGDAGVTRQSWRDTLLPGAGNLNLFTFEFAYEMVPGDWTFSIELDGAPALSVPFTVVPVRASGPVEDACFQFMSALPPGLASNADGQSLN